MSKITNNDLTRSGTGCFIAVPIWQQWKSKGQLCSVDTDDSVTLETNTRCSPRWVVYRLTGVRGAILIRQARTQRQCLDFCVANTSCVSVQWVKSFNHCWIEPNSPVRHRGPSFVTLYEIVRPCATTPGRPTWCYFSWKTLDTSVYNIHLDSLRMFITSTRAHSAQARDANAKC